MLALTRKNKIKDIIMEQKNVMVSELAELFSVTEETIRRDLKALEESGVLIRTYGGAYVQDGVVNDIRTPIRKNILASNKQRIAKKCAEFIHSGDSIILDPSTTAYYICNEVKTKRLTVLTDSLSVAQFFADYANIHLIVTGGTYMSTYACFTGKISQNTVSSYYVDKAFLSFSSLDMSRGMSDSNEDIAAMHRIQVEHAKKVYVLADHTKFDNVSFASTGGIGRIDAIVTDAVLSKEWHEYLDKQGIELYECTD